MTWLKKLGQIILQGAQIAAGIAPFAKAILPGQADQIQTISNDLAQIAGIVTTAEAMGQAINAPGAQKLTMAAPMVAQIIMQSSVLAGHKIADSALFSKGCAEIAGGTADILNSLQAKVEVESKT